MCEAPSHLATDKVIQPKVYLETLIMTFWTTKDEPNLNRTKSPGWCSGETEGLC